MAKLGDVFECQITGEWGNECSENEIGTKVLRTTNFTPEGIINYDDVVIRSINETKVEKKRLRYGDIILEKSGGTEKTPVGRVVFCDESIEKGIYLCNNFTQAMRVNQDIAIPRYVFYFMWNLHYSGRTDLLQNKTTGIRNLQVKSYLNENCPIPPLDEQRKIAAVLDKVSSLIAKRRQQLDKLDELIKARFVEMFGDEHHLDDWNCVSVGEVADICVGVVIKPTQYYTDQGGVPAFRSLNIGAMTIKNADWVYFTKEGHEKNKKSIVCENDVLVVRSGAPGTACVVTKEFSGYNAVDIIIAHPNIEKINSVFLAMFTNMPHGMNQIREKTGGAAQQHFNVGGYKELTVILPPIELQNQFAAFVEQTEKTKTTISESLQQLETLKKALMQEYFG